MSRIGIGRLILAVVGSYLGFGLVVAATERIISSVTTSGGISHRAYFVADVWTQCLYLLGAGYVCSVVARPSDRLAIAVLTVLGLLASSFSLAMSWNSEPHWYGIALLVTYAPCVWAGWALRRGSPRAKLK